MATNIPPLDFNEPITPSEKPAAPIRADLSDLVLDGRLGEICQKRLKMFPLAYSWAPLVAAAGTLIPRADTWIRTNLYSCVVGPMGSGKSQSRDWSCAVVGLTEPRLIKGKFGSAEGLIAKLKDVGPNAHRLIDVDELGHLMSKAAIDRASFPYVLNSAYYDDHQSGGTKSHQYEFDCRLSLVGGLVEDRFSDSFG